MPACQSAGSAAFIQHCCPIATFSRLPILHREINEAFSKRRPTDRERDRNIRSNGRAGLGGSLTMFPGLLVVRPLAAFPGSRAA
jgi:hypothetical protein